MNTTKHVKGAKILGGLKWEYLKTSAKLFGEQLSFGGAKKG